MKKNFNLNTSPTSILNFPENCGASRRTKWTNKWTDGHPVTLVNRIKPASAE